MLPRDSKIFLTTFGAALVICFIYFGDLHGPMDIDYGLIFDAGSTGSRIHVFEFEAKSGHLLKEILQEVQPGLQAFNDPDEAARSLIPLMETAVNTIPPHRHSTTPLAFKATAGLRKLGTEKAEALLQAVRNFLESYDFALDDDAVAIIPGSEEGIFGWITVNYLLGRFDEPTDSSVSIMDLGGSSTQVVFEPNPDSLASAPASQVVQLTLGKRDHKLYMNSYEGFGLNDARQKIFELVAKKDNRTAVAHPCIPKGFQEIVLLQGKMFRFVPPKSPSYANCAALIRKILLKNKSCRVKPCSFNGVFQPDISDPDVFQDDIYAFSYFFDRTQFIDGKRYPELTVQDFKDRAEAACTMEVEDRVHGVLCLDLTYMHLLLSEGYGLQGDQLLKIYKKIDGIETAWPLGAVIALMNDVHLAPSS